MNDIAIVGGVLESRVQKKNKVVSLMVRVGNNVEPMIGRIGALNQMINDPEVLSKCSCLVVIADDFVLVKARREKGGNVETPLRLAKSVASQALRGLATNADDQPRLRE